MGIVPEFICVCLTFSPLMSIYIRSKCSVRFGNIVDLHSQTLLAGYLIIDNWTKEDYTFIIYYSQIGIEKQSIKYVGGQLDCLLQPRLPEMDVSDYGTGEEQHMTVIQTFDGLCKILRSLDGLPLAINTTQGVSPVFRSTEVSSIFPKLLIDSDFITVFYYLKPGFHIIMIFGNCQLWELFSLQ